MSIFHFNQFSIQQTNSILKVGTDAMVLGSLVKTGNASHVLDIGTGTGVLALMMAQMNSTANVTAVEVDELSAKDCKENFTNSPWNHRLEIIVKDILEFEADNHFDLIICNPPFYSNSLSNENKRLASAKHAVHLPFDQLFQKIASLLSENGKYWMILPFQDKQLVSDLAEKSGLFPEIDYSVNGKPNQPVRTVFCFGQLKSTTIESHEITIRNHDNSYTEAYKKLTVDFHGVKL